MKEQPEMAIIRAEFGDDVYWRMVETFGGQSIYIPKRPLLLRKRQEMRAEFLRIKNSGMADSAANLAISKRFGVSRKWARAICYGQLELELIS